MDPFVQQLADLCRLHVTRSKWVFVPTHAVGRTIGEHADWPAHEAAELPYLQAEENRLLYVAATRARQLLIVSRQVPQKGTAAWGVLNSFMASAKELNGPAVVSTTPPRAASSSAEVQAEASVARSKTHDAVTPESSIDAGQSVMRATDLWAVALQSAGDGHARPSLC